MEAQGFDGISVIDFLPGRVLEKRDRKADVLEGPADGPGIVQAGPERRIRIGIVADDDRVPPPGVPLPSRGRKFSAREKNEEEDAGDDSGVASLHGKPPSSEKIAGDRPAVKAARVLARRPLFTFF